MEAGGAAAGWLCVPPRPAHSLVLPFVSFCVDTFLGHSGGALPPPSVVGSVRQQPGAPTEGVNHGYRWACRCQFLCDDDDDDYDYDDDNDDECLGSSVMMIMMMMLMMIFLSTSHHFF